MKISGIYKIINKVNGKYYVGSSMDIVGDRWIQHRRKLRGNYHQNEHLQSAWNKYGEHNFDWVIVEKTPIDSLLLVEQKHLTVASQEKRKCYNKSFIAGRVEMTDEIKQKISIAMTGEKNHQFGVVGPNKGKPISEKQKLRQSKKMKGRYLGKNNPMFGRHHSEETKKKIRTARRNYKGSNNPMFGRHHTEESNQKNRESNLRRFNLCKISDTL